MHKPIQLVRWQEGEGSRIGIKWPEEGAAVPVDAVLPDIHTIWELIDHLDNAGRSIDEWAESTLADPPLKTPLSHLLPPLETSQLWAADHTFSGPSNTAPSLYGRMAAEDRPLLAFKGGADPVAGPDQALSMRSDALCHIPEPEVVAVVDGAGELFGYTLGVDMTARDLLEENPSYLSQAKAFPGCAGLGPTLVIAQTVDLSRLKVQIQVVRHERLLFTAQFELSQLAIPLNRLLDHLFQTAPKIPWTGLMMGTGVEFPFEFALETRDQIFVTCPEIGTLHHVVLEKSARKSSSAKIMCIHPQDNVAVALGKVRQGQVVAVKGSTISSRAAIPFGHKIAIAPIKSGA